VVPLDGSGNAEGWNMLPSGGKRMEEHYECVMGFI